jgi:RNA polymerase sigma factor (sigma-70 family)
MDLDPESSLTLLKRIQTGDAAALDALMARYRPRLVRWASGRLPPYARDLAETQDLVQDTLIRAFRKIGEVEVRGEGALQAYLRQALLNTLRTELRRVRRRPAGTELETGVPSGEPSPLEQAVSGETIERYERALSTLRPADRELVIAHIEFGFSHRELASAFDRPTPNAARMALQRALLQLANEMRPESRNE